MSWIAISPPRVGQFPGVAVNEVLADRALLADSGAGWLERGSILIEVHLAPISSPERLIDIAYDYPRRGRMSLYALPGGAIALVLTRGAEVRHAAVQVSRGADGALLRITYRWDMARGQAMLWAEAPGLPGLPSGAVVADPLPMPRAALAQAVAASADGQVGPMVQLLALSDREEPVGPMPGLVGRTLIATPDGARRVDQLQRGDLVSVPGIGAVPVLARVARTVPARGSFAPVLIEAPRFGLSQDIALAAGQRILISGSDVEYLFGSENVLVPASHLIGEGIAHYCRPRRTVEYVHLLLPQQEPICAAGALVESLPVGRLRRRADILAASLLNNVPMMLLPDHPAPAYPILTGFEAVTLAGYRAA